MTQDIKAKSAANAKDVRLAIAGAIEALEFYAERDNYDDKLVTEGCGCCSRHDPAPVHEDLGEKALNALVALS